jgi:hypothetical protein
MIVDQGGRPLESGRNSVITECVQNLKVAVDAESQNRAEGLQDPKFAAGDH